MLEFQIERCKQRYIGTTGRQLKFHLDEHRGYIINQVTSEATGAPLEPARPQPGRPQCHNMGANKYKR